MDRRPLPDNVFVAESSIHGRGCFALRGLLQGEWIGAYEGELTSDDAEHVLWVDFGSNGQQQWRGVAGRNDLRYVNHSSAGNAQFVGVDLFALRDIEPGEEVTVHYGDDWDHVD